MPSARYRTHIFAVRAASVARNRNWALAIGFGCVAGAFAIPQLREWLGSGPLVDLLLPVTTLAYVLQWAFNTKMEMDQLNEWLGARFFPDDARFFYLFVATALCWVGMFAAAFGRQPFWYALAFFAMTLVTWVNMKAGLTLLCAKIQDSKALLATDTDPALAARNAAIDKALDALAKYLDPQRHLTRQVQIASLAALGALLARVHAQTGAIYLAALILAWELQIQVGWRRERDEALDGARKARIDAEDQLPKDQWTLSES